MSDCLPSRVAAFPPSISALTAPYSAVRALRRLARSLKGPRHD